MKYFGLMCFSKIFWTYYKSQLLEIDVANFM